jgi:hypothetical protein
MRLMHPVVYLASVTPLDLLKAAWHGRWIDTRTLSRYTMTKLDCNIYGEDITETAEACAAAALANPHPDKGTGSRASEGGGGDERYSTAEVKTIRGIANDSRAVSKGGHAATATHAKSERE